MKEPSALSDKLPLLTSLTSTAVKASPSASLSLVNTPGANTARTTSSSVAYESSTATGASLTSPTVTITVGDVNDAPVAVDDSYATDEDVVLAVFAPGVLTNDSDADGDALTAVLVSDVSNGSLSLSADGSFIYTPAL